jgi:membrane-associated phospholipid phosphatase
MSRHIAAAILTVSVLAGPAVLPSPAFGQVQPGSSSLGDLFADTLDDFRRLPSVESVTILSIGAVGASIGGGFDTDVTSTLSSSRDLGRFFGAGESMGSAQTQAAAAMATYLVGRAIDHPRMAAVGADLVSVQIVTQALNGAIKLSVGRNRPDGTDYSFPSGHSSTAFATATVLQRHLGWKVGVPAYALATYVATSRVQVKRHFLSDVTFGAALGIVAGRSVTVGRGAARFAVAPTPALGGGGVQFTWIGE